VKSLKLNIKRGAAYLKPHKWASPLTRARPCVIASWPLPTMPRRHEKHMDGCLRARHKHKEKGRLHGFRRPSHSSPVKVTRLGRASVRIVEPQSREHVAWSKEKARPKPRREKRLELTYRTLYVGEHRRNPERKEYKAG
jgi:hypothetical protein